MPKDPLNPATRLAKRNLIGLSALAITVRAFDIKIDKLPITGLTLSVNEGAFRVCAFIGIIYFFIQFFLYRMSDFLNNDEKDNKLIISNKNSEISSYITSLIFKKSIKINNIDKKIGVIIANSDKNPFDLYKKLKIYHYRNLIKDCKFGLFLRIYLSTKLINSMLFPCIILLYFPEETNNKIRDVYFDFLVPLFISIIAILSITGIININTEKFIEYITYPKNT